MDLPTLHSILVEYELKSNKVSKQFSKLYKELSIKKIYKIFEAVFEKELFDKLSSLSAKHSSIWSRELVTAVLDDSIFKQWLSSFQTGQDFEACFASFFSGQTNSSVYGFKVGCFGIVIDGVYYPLYLEFVPKKSKKQNGGKTSSIIAAEKLVRRYDEWNKAVKDKGLEIPKLHFSCDNGYNNMDLADTCKRANLIYISVPRKNERFEINGKTSKLSDWIEEEYLAAEQKHQEQQSQLPTEQQQAFVYRFKAKYLSKGRSFTLIAFRLNGSRKISVVYCDSDTIFAKTLRRHWFQRTYIEQFFKILKHVLKIQESRTRDKDSFSFKLLRFAFLALHVQKLVKFARRKIKNFDKRGFITIQRSLRKNPHLDTLLHQLIITKN